MRTKERIIYGLLFLVAILTISWSLAFAGPGTGKVDRAGYNVIKTDSTGAIDSFTQDQTTPPLDLYFTQAINSPTALTNSLIINDISLVVDDPANFSAGNYLGMFSGTSLEGRFFFGEVISVIGNTINLDSPIDFEFQPGDPVISTTRELNVNGSGTTQIFAIQIGGPTTPITVDITRIMIQATTNGAPDFSDFGDIADGLINGVVLRQIDGTTRNFWNVKTNGEFANIAFDYADYVAANPGLNVNGFAVRFTFAGQDKHGVAVRLHPSDRLEILIQDDISSLVTFRVIAQGHIVLP